MDRRCNFRSYMLNYVRTAVPPLWKLNQGSVLIIQEKVAGLLLDYRFAHKVRD